MLIYSTSDEVIFLFNFFFITSGRSVDEINEIDHDYETLFLVEIIKREWIEQKLTQTEYFEIGGLVKSMLHDID